MKKSKGFTIIELLIVIIVIAILSAIAVPQYRKMSKRAQISTAVSELDMMYKANALYYADTGQYSLNEEGLGLYIGEIDTIFAGGSTFSYSYDPLTSPNTYLITAEGAGGTITMNQLKDYTCSGGFDADWCP